ncbi:uncharacterized protein LOC124336197 isoform X1 [Daphnia pulicaria]|uniref:uncharacterized protein LOC124336197 isoform X1 n=1 Tax=Daphnia pulicaria TaxID=35523 RepID=UPI001EEACD06|nr:uncharacterized protein LOC124336197 isoform X1 [Daphnia pulicaria]
MTRLLLASVHHAILVFSCASLLLFGSLSIGDTIGKSSDRDGHENQTAVTAPAEHRGSTKAGHKYWRWGYRKTNQIDRLELPRTAIEDDEKWMQKFDVPRLHSIFDRYLKTVKKTKWMGRIGKSLQTKWLKSMLSNSIDRHSSSTVKGGPDDVEHLQPRMDISFWNLVPCYSIHTEPGLCLSTTICAAIGGTPSGSCMHRMSMTKTCCIINKILTTCSANVVANNTYWQSPLFGVDSGSVCVMALHLNTGVIRQNLQSICQVRLDFDMFSIAQPNTASVCSTDVFRVAGSLNTVPPICGDNSRQHMYLTSKSTARNIQLIFSIGSAPTIDRSWRMKISLLPCDADYLAPPNCLQYITESTGTVKSFNWKDVAASTTSQRQLADQDYQICFRTELVGSNQQVPNTHCLTECSTTNGGLAFSLSRLATVGGLTSSAGGSGVAAGSQCANDFLFFLGGFDVLGNFNDRFCGNRLNPTPGSAISTPICSKFKPFHFRYVTDGAETGDGSNNGFCLNFVQF